MVTQTNYRNFVRATRLENRMNPRIVEKRITCLLGKEVWGASLGVGSFVTMEFGREIKASGGYVHGEWHLWIYDCAWRIETGSRVLATSEDRRSLLKKTIKSLNGRKLRGVKILSPMVDLVLRFEGDLILRTFGVHSAGAEHWMLFLPEERGLVIGPGTTASYKSRNRLIG